MKSLRDPYLFEFGGECLGDIVPSGTTLRADPAQEIRPMDVVSVLLEGFDGPWGRLVNGLSDGGFCGVVKVFLGFYQAAGEPVCLLGQLNPPTIALIPHSHVAAVDKVVSPFPDITDTDKQALALLVPFAGLGCAADEHRKAS